MHELALMESLVDAVGDEIGDRRIAVVRIEVGRLVAAIPDTLRFCFELCSRGTSLEGATLEVIDVPGQASCRACGAGVAVGPGLSPCFCGSFDLEVTAGNELRLREVEVI